MNSFISNGMIWEVKTDEIKLFVLLCHFIILYALILHRYI